MRLYNIAILALGNHWLIIWVIAIKLTMASSSLNHSSQQQYNPLVGEVSNILRVWGANGPVHEMQDWPATGVYNPLIIKAFQTHVWQYQMVHSEEPESDMRILDLFLKR